MQSSIDGARNLSFAERVIQQRERKDQLAAVEATAVQPARPQPR